MDFHIHFGLLVIKICHCRFIVITNVPFWERMLLMGEAVHVREHEANGETLDLPLNFAVNLKLL